jgi:Raf kinase inhibitor-like YbhB/YbcL family protein
MVRAERQACRMSAKRFLSLVGALVLLVGVALGSRSFAAETISLRSGSFAAGGRIPLRYASTLCEGSNVAPSLWWSGMPALTRSIMLTVRDPQGRSGAGLWHWIVYDVPASANGIPASADGRVVPPGAATATNGHGLRGYSGPCPPRGETHRYTFVVYALDEAFVQVKPSVRPRDLLGAISSHVLATGTLVGTYSR